MEAPLNHAVELLLAGDWHPSSASQRSFETAGGRIKERRDVHFAVRPPLPIACAQASGFVQGWELMWLGGEVKHAFPWLRKRACSKEASGQGDNLGSPAHVEAVSWLATSSGISVV
jgi:hypothetical protein